jgi:hypothetical protein
LLCVFKIEHPCGKRIGILASSPASPHAGWR